MTEYCRLCAELKDPDEIPASIIILQSIEQKLCACCQWTTENTEHRLPHGVCSICLDKLDKCWLFAQSVQLAQQKLLEIFENIADAKPLASEIVQTVYDSTEHSSHLTIAIAFEIQSDNTEAANFLCRICHKSFQGHEPLQEHYAQQSEHKCEICSQEFCSTTELDAHRQQGCEGMIEIGSNTDECKPTAIDCNSDENESDADEDGENLNSFASTGKKPKKNSTQRIKSSSKDHKCFVCGRIFTKKSNLTRHQRTHTGERLYQCDECGARSKEKYYIVTHRFDMPFR